MSLDAPGRVDRFAVAVRDGDAVPLDAVRPAFPRAWRRGNAVSHLKPLRSPRRGVRFATESRSRVTPGRPGRPRIESDDWPRAFGSPSHSLHERRTQDKDLKGVYSSPKVWVSTEYSVHIVRSKQLRSPSARQPAAPVPVGSFGLQVRLLRLVDARTEIPTRPPQDQEVDRSEDPFVWARRNFSASDGREGLERQGSTGTRTRAESPTVRRTPCPRGRVPRPHETRWNRCGPRSACYPAHKARESAAGPPEKPSLSAAAPPLAAELGGPFRPAGQTPPPARQATTNRWLGGRHTIR